MKKNIRFFLALWAAKGAELALRVLRRHASFLPGKIALTLCPDFMGRIGRPKTVVCVTGTNGKTTVSNMITAALAANGKTAANNGYGSNVAAGIASVLLGNCDMAGNPKEDLAVLETDERSSLRVYPYIKPDYVVCNNIMRDSIKRNANTDFISYIISSALPENTKMILNADDIICSELGSEKNEKIFFGVECHDPQEDRPNDIRDITYCPRCGARLAADYYRYNHIGRVHCTNCDFKSAIPDYNVTNIDRSEESISVSMKGKVEKFRMVNDNITNIYNMAAVIALMDQLGYQPEQIRKALDKAQVVKSRFDSDEVCGKTVTTQLAKSQNPIACSRAIHYLADSAGKDKVAIVIIDDKHENTGDTENVSWMYDCDYSGFADDSVKKIIFAGPRCKDHVVRACLAGVDPEKIITAPREEDALALIDPLESDCFFILHDLYLVSEAAQLKRELTEKIKEACKK